MEPSARTVASDAPLCAHCLRKGVDLKFCARCMVACYCSAACQKAAWKLHKSTCAPCAPQAPVPNMMAVLAAQFAACCGNPECSVGRATITKPLGRLPGQWGAALKTCKKCLLIPYCSAACQKADWKVHKQVLAQPQLTLNWCTTAAYSELVALVSPAKQVCTPPPSQGELLESVGAAFQAADWEGLLRWESRVEELLAHQSDVFCERVLWMFTHAHTQLDIAAGGTEHTVSILCLEERRAELLCKLERFRDQGETLCGLAENVLLCHGSAGLSGSAKLYQQARKIGEQHGFFSVECKACIGLGRIAHLEGRYATLEAATQGQIDGFFSQLPSKCPLPEVASVGE